MSRYIDADYLDELITQLNQEGRDITRNEYKMIDSILFEFPTADVQERKRGQWITSKMPVTGAIENKCSECGTPFYMAFNLQMNFCPNCGADMRKETEDDSVTK